MFGSVKQSSWHGQNMVAMVMKGQWSGAATLLYRVPVHYTHYKHYTPETFNDSNQFDHEYLIRRCNVVPQPFVVKTISNK